MFGQSVRIIMLTMTSSCIELCSAGHNPIKWPGNVTSTNLQIDITQWLGLLMIFWLWSFDHLKRSVYNLDDMLILEGFMFLLSFSLTSIIQFDIIQFDIYLVDSNPLTLAETSHGTRGHSLKLKKIRSNTTMRQKFFSLRVTNTWNDLPESIVNAPSVNSLKNRLDKHWSERLYILFSGVFDLIHTSELLNEIHRPHSLGLFNCGTVQQKYQWNEIHGPRESCFNIFKMNARKQNAEVTSQSKTHRGIY